MDDTDASNDEFATREIQVTPASSDLSKSSKDHYVTVFTISKGEVTFQRKGSQKWFTDGSTDGCQEADESKSQNVPCSISTSHPHRVTPGSPDRNYVTSISCSPERKYRPRPTSACHSDVPSRRYDREAILKKHSRGGRWTDYGFIDSDLMLRDRTLLCSGDLPPSPGSALTDDEKVAAQFCNGSLHGTTSPEILLAHPHYQVSIDFLNDFTLV